MIIMRDLPARYELDGVVKESAFSINYTGKDKISGKKVFIKFIPKESLFYDIIYNDFMMLFQFKHPNFVQVNDFGIIEGKGLYYVMPQYKKIDPVKLIKEDKISFFLEVFFQLLCGLHFLHQRKKLHGNLNPNNVIISKENDKIRVRMSDYVIASFIKPKDLIASTEFKEYIAPELITEHNASFTTYTDYYSLGVILFKMIYDTIPIDEYFIIHEENILANDKINPLIDVDEGIIKIILKLLNKNPDFRYQNSQQILKDLMPFLKKYNIKEKKESFIWKNVLLEIRKNKQIELKFYGEKIIKDILYKISKDFTDKRRINLSVISANNSLDVKLITDFIYFTYKHDNIPVVKITNIDENNVEKFIFDTIKYNISASSLKQNSSIILLIENCYDFLKSQDQLFKILKNNREIKIIVGIDDNDCNIKKAVTGVKINYHKVKKLSVSEIKEYLKMYFGYGVLPSKMEEYLLYQSNRDLKVLNQYIDYYIEKDIILYRNLKWYFRMELFDEKDIPKQIEEEISEKIKRYEKDILLLLSTITFWKNNFTIKELAQISESTILKVDTRINLLKKHQFVLQGKKFYTLYFPFLKVSLEKYLPTDIKTTALFNILNYLNGQKTLSIEEKAILFNIYEHLDMKKELLDIALSIVDNSYDTDIVEKILKKIYKLKDTLEEYDREKLYFLMIRYSWKLAESDKIEEAEKIYEFLKDKNLINGKFKLSDMFKIIYAYHLLNKSEYEKIIQELKDFDYNLLDSLNKISLLKILAQAYDRLAEYEKEKKILLNIIKESKQLKDADISAIKINATINLAKIEDRNENIVKAYEILNGINIKTKKNPYLAITVYSYLAKLNIKMKKMSAAEKNLKTAENILIKTEISGDTRLFWEVKSLYLFLTGNYWQALLCNNKAFIQFLKRGIFNFHLYVFKIILLLRIGFIKQAHYLIIDGLKNNSFTSPQKENLFVLKNYTRYLLEGKFEEHKDIVSIIKSRMLLPFDYYLQHFNYLNSIGDNKTLKKIDKFLSSLKIKLQERNTDLFSIKMSFYYSTNQINKALSILNKLFKFMNPLTEYSEYFNYFAYKIKKEAFQQNVTIDDYKKYLKKARLIIQRKTELMPNDHFKSTYLKQKLISSIIYYYKVDIIGSVEISNNSDFLDTIEEMTKIISKLTDRKKLFTEILKLALKVSKTERGIIYTYDDKNDKLYEEYYFQFSRESLDNIKSYIEDVLNKVIKSKQSIFQTYADNEPIGKIKSVISIPLIIHNNVIGLVYMDSKNLISFSPEEIKFLNIFAHLAGSALETSDIYNNLINEKEQLSLLIKTPNRYVDLGLLGNSPAMVEVFKKIEKISKTNVNVLIQGESGTGKELVAKAIYQSSLLSDKPFIPVDCGSLSGDIIESELFGHVKGAFTSAYFDKKGLFEEANGGTIFLDEISNISLSVQAKLLRVLQEGEIKRIGENTVRKVNVRIIAASNIELKELVKEGKFREDLYFRLCTFPIYLPPLRKRKEDIKTLAIYFVNYYSKLHNKNISGLTEKAYKILSHYDWPGNVRELKNELERAVILYNGSKKVIDESYFKHLISDNYFDENKDMPIGNFNDLVNDYKIKLIENAYEKSGKNWTKTAKLLGISRQNLNQIYKRLKKRDF